MRIIYSITLCFVIVFAVQASSEMLFHHETPHSVLRGEDAIFEIMLTSSNRGLYDMYLFYRPFGESEYQMVPMDRDGMLYSATLNTHIFTTGMIEYYFGYEEALGAVSTFPSQSPELHPFQMRIAPTRAIEQQSPVEIIILSPQPDEVVNNDELVIAASVIGLETDFDFSNTTLLIDGINMSNMVQFEEGILTFAPNQIRAGTHNIELNILDVGKNLIGKKEWSFRATGGAQRVLGGKKFGGLFFIENRNKNTASGDDNYLRSGFQVNGRADAIDWRARIIYSSEEEETRQPVNRYSLQGRWNFSDRNNIYLKLGDFTPNYSPLTFQNKRVRGVQTGLAFGFFTLDFISGQLNRGVEGKVSKDSVGNITNISGFTYEESILALRPGFRFGDFAHWHLNLLNAKEEKANDEVQSGVKESLVFGTDLNMNFDNKRILFDASFQASINNSDAASPEVDFDSVAQRYDLEEGGSAESAWNLLESTGFLSMTQGLNPFPSYGMRFQTQLRYFNNNFVVRYTNIDRDFATRGNPYLVRDVAGFYIADNFRMINNQIFVNLFYKNFMNNKSSEESETKNTEFGAALSYFPLENIPSLTVSFSNIGRSNDVTESDSGVAAIPEDNTTQLLTVSTSYNVDFGEIRNTLLLNFNNYNRDEKAESRENNDNTFNAFGIGLISRFKFPLTTRLNFSTEKSEIKFTGGSDSVLATTNSIQRFSFGAEYMFRDIFGNGHLKPFFDLTFQTSKIEETGIEIKRNNYTFGLMYRNSDYGIFSLRYDVISYENFDSDSILNAKYQYNF
jgi:hypothetical protein